METVVHKRNWIVMVTDMWIHKTPSHLIQHNGRILMEMDMATIGATLIGTKLVSQNGLVSSSLERYRPIIVQIPLATRLQMVSTVVSIMTEMEFQISSSNQKRMKQMMRTKLKHLSIPITIASLTSWTIVPRHHRAPSSTLTVVKLKKRKTITNLLLLGSRRSFLAMLIL